MMLLHILLVVPFLVAPVSALYAAAVQKPLMGIVDDSKVNVTLYVMSRCPDARLCEGIFEDVLQTKGIIEKVNLDLQYISHFNKTAQFGVTCKHGDLECIGNIHQLCLHHHLPLAQSYATLTCQNYPSPFPGRIGELDFTKECADANHVDWDGSGVGACIKGKGGRVGKEGLGLLQHSARVVAERGVEKSCTIEIASTVKRGDDKRVCVVDGGVWTGCDDGHTAADFVRVIEEEWDALRK